MTIKSISRYSKWPLWNKIIPDWEPLIWESSLVGVLEEERINIQEPLIDELSCCISLFFITSLLFRHIRLWKAKPLFQGLIIWIQDLKSNLCDTDTARSYRFITFIIKKSPKSLLLPLCRVQRGLSSLTNLHLFQRLWIKRQCHTMESTVGYGQEFWLWVSTLDLTSFVPLGKVLVPQLLQLWNVGVNLHALDSQWALLSEDVEKWNAWHFKLGNSFLITLKSSYMQCRTIGMLWNVWLSWIYLSHIAMSCISTIPSPLFISFVESFLNIFPVLISFTSHAPWHLCLSPD